MENGARYAVLRSWILNLIIMTLVMGQTSAPLNATVGQSVLIPCSLTVNSKSYQWIYWQEDGTEKVLYDWKNETGKTDRLHTEYKNRCQVSDTDLSSGNISITLNNVSVHDDKKTFWASVGFTDGERLQHQCKSTLQVSALYKDLKVTFNTTVNTATCTTRGGYPKPEVTWTGHNQSSTVQLVCNTSLQQNLTEETFSVTSTVSIKDLKNVTCFVYNPGCDQHINATALINGPDEDTNIHIWVPVVVTVIVIVIGIAVSIRYKDRFKCLQACCRGYSPPNESAHSNETNREQCVSYHSNHKQEAEEFLKESDEPQSIEREKE